MKGNGGFDVIIGNPPYVEYKKKDSKTKLSVYDKYKLNGYNTIECDNLFAFAIERSIVLLNLGSNWGMIVPLSSISTDRMIPLISLLHEKSSHISNYSWRPGRLFDGANLQLSIIIGSASTQDVLRSTKYLMWDSNTREILFSKIMYSSVEDKTLLGAIPKLGDNVSVSILNKLRSQKQSLSSVIISRQQNDIVYYRRGGLYWKVFVDKPTGSSEEKVLNLIDSTNRYLIIALLSSDLWWYYFTITSDCRHLGNRDISSFPFDYKRCNTTLINELTRLGQDYVKDLFTNAENTVRIYKGLRDVECISFKVKYSKPIIDEIDKVLAKHYGFTEEELDFIINYDIKYRMGDELNEEE